MKDLLNKTVGEAGNEPAAPGYDAAVDAAREDMLDRVLFGSGIVAVAGVFLHVLGSDAFGLVAYLAAAAILFVLRSRAEWSTRRRIVGLMVILYLMALLDLTRSGLASSAGLFLAALPPLAYLLVGVRAGIITAIACVGTWLGAWLAFEIGELALIFPSPESMSLEWWYRGVDLVWVIVILSQLQQQFREAQDYVVTVAQQKRDLQDARAELTKRTNQLDYERYLLHTLLDTVSDKIFFKDLSGRYTRISQAVAQQFGIPPQFVLGKTDFDFFSIDYAQEIQSEERKMLDSGEPTYDKIERETWKDGRPDTWAIKSRLPLKGEDGRVIGSFGMSRDITDIKKVQEMDKRHAQQLGMVAEVGRAVTSSLDIENLLRVLVELVQEAFVYYGVNVWLLTEPNDAVRLLAGFSPQGQDLGSTGVSISIDEANIINQVCLSGVHELNNELSGEENIPLKEKFPEARSILVLPLRVADKVLGALEIRSGRADAFHDEDVTLLRSLADQVTIAIRNASLYQAEQSRRHFAERLYQVVRALSSTLKLSEVLNLILQQLDEIIPSERSSLLLYEGEVLRMVAVRGFPESYEGQGARVSVSAGDVFDQIYRTQEPLSISDVTLRPDWQQVPDLPLARSWLGVPLILYDRVSGMLSLTRQTVSPFTLGEQTLAKTFAGQAALALENARLYEGLANFNQQLEKMVEQRTEELRQAYTQLERMDTTKSNFIAVTSHELRTPLTVLRGYSQMLLQNSTVQNDPGIAPLVSGINTGAARLHDIVNSMLDIAKIDSKALQLSHEPLSLAFLVKGVASTFDGALKQRSLAINLEGLGGLPSIEADAEALQKVFSQLFSNAIKYTPDGGKITVAGRMLAPNEYGIPEDGVEITVRDTGIGIDPEFREMIFTKFYQTGEVALHSTGKTKFKGGGPGLGLPIARGIVEAHHGKLWVDSGGYDEKLLPGSCFHIVLPARQQSPVSLN